jgi:superfamily II RNA helicase
VEAIDAMDTESPTYALDVVSLMEAIQENPGVVLLKQVDLAKKRAVDAMKAEGIEYDERMKELEKIDRPKPLQEFLYLTFDEFREHHPWLEGENVRPKSVARDLWEQGMSFNDYVKEYGLARSEGVLLHYLSQAVKALVQNVPEDAKTEELYDITESLAASVRMVDASLLDEWERLGDPEKQAADSEVVEDEEPDITRDKKAFTAMIRNECFRFMRALGRGRFEEAAKILVETQDAWDAERLAEAMAKFREAHGALRLDAEARAPKNLLVRPTDEAWMLTQILLDEDDDRDFRFEARVDLDLARQEGRPRLELLSLGDEHN